MAEGVKILGMIAGAIKAAGIAITCVGGLKFVIGLMSHDSSQNISNISCVFGGVVTYAIAGIIAGINLNFG